MKIYYWAPFLSNIATISSVIKSIESIKSYSKKSIEISIIDSVGEWGKIEEKTKNIKIIRLYNKSLIDKLPKGGVLKSRLTQLFIFCFCFFKLLNLLKKNEPDYIVAHLIVSLPLTVMSFLHNKTKLIIRISGLPRLNLLRKIYWTFFEKNIYKVSCPTIATLEKFKSLKMFSQNKLALLYDPVLSPKEIIIKKKEEITLNLDQKKIIIAIGRLTTQKNFSFLLSAFALLKKKYPEYHLLILGEGEERKKLKFIIDDLKLSKCVNLLGHKENVYKYLKKAECFILSSLWEDPGFVLLEASYLNIPIIASNCPNGPREILQDGLGGFLFNNNNKENFIEKFDNFFKSSKKDLKTKLIKSKIYSKKFTKFHHYLQIKKILDI